MNNPESNSHAFALGAWLLFCAAVVYLMIIVGGITRLTQSGLSMVEWAPIMGVIPPINEAQWLEVFAKYKTSPEYLKVNAGMSLDAFKSIFYWEYGHRVLGRVIGLIYLLPLLFFIIKGMVPRAWFGRLTFLFVLGGLQGLMGWYMVKSGLVDVPHVSQYRLTAHLGLALLIFSFMLWFALDFLRGQTSRPVSLHSNLPQASLSHETSTQVPTASNSYLKATALVVLIVFIMMLSGGFVAGTKAGFIINTFPTMNGQWIPDNLFALTPVWRNFFENAVTIQFIHRSVAVLVLLAVLISYISSKRQKFKTYGSVVLGITGLQICLGISALMLGVPLVLGAAHQAGAVALLGAALLAAHVARKVA